METKILGFPKFGYIGRIGNMLFEFASAFGIASRCGRTLALPEWPFKEFVYSPHVIPRDQGKYPEIMEQGFAYCGDFMYHMLNNDYKRLDISGYLQSERYFSHVIPQIKKFLEWKPEIRAKVVDKYFDQLQGNSVAIHIRRGDYVGNDNYISLPLEYYISSLRLIPNRDFVFVFSDDIKWCKEHMVIMAYKLVFVEGNTDMEDLCLMSLCRNYIIANSSFSWWGAWLGEGSGSIVVHPGAIFKGGMADYDIKDYFPKRWVENKKWLHN